MAVTRRDLRRKIASNLRDLLVLKATGGSDNTVIDPVTLTDADNTFISSEILCTKSADPANLGQIARVTGYTRLSNQISFTPSFPAPVVAGDEFEIVNLRGRGFRVQEYNLQIETIVAGLADLHMRHVTSDPFLFNYESPTIGVPPDWRGIYAVTSLRDRGSDYSLKPARFPGARGWSVDVPTRSLSIGGSDLHVCNGFNMIVHGLYAHPLPELDTDRIYIDDVYISLEAQANLAQRRGDRSWDQWAIEWARMAAGQRPARIFRYPANTVLFEEV